MLSCNQFAMENLSKGGEGIDLLKKAEILLEKSRTKLDSRTLKRLLDMTYNNLGCCYKK